MNTILNRAPDMNLEEATAKHQELKAIHGVARSMLLEMRDRKGWKALGMHRLKIMGIRNGVIKHRTYMA